MLKRYFKIILAIEVFIRLLCFTPMLQAEDLSPSQKTIANVNGSVITQADLFREIERVKQQAARSGQFLDESMMLKLKNDVLEGLIDQELLYQESIKNGVKVDNGLIEKEWGRIADQFPSEIELNKALTSQNLSEAIIRRQIERGLAINQLINDKIVDKINVSPKEIRDYYDNNPKAFMEPEEIRASHILIKVEPNADQAQRDSALNKIKELQSRLQNGEDFASLAKEFSEGPSKTGGGDLGKFKRGQMVKPFEDAAFALKRGEISDVVETKFGFHLIKVFEKNPETLIDYEKVKVKLENYIRQGKTQDRIKVYLIELEREAKIVRFSLPPG